MNIVYKETKDFTEQEVEELFLSVKWLSGKYPERLIKIFVISSNRMGWNPISWPHPCTG